MSYGEALGATIVVVFALVWIIVLARSLYVIFVERVRDDAASGFIGVNMIILFIFGGASLLWYLTN